MIFSSSMHHTLLLALRAAARGTAPWTATTLAARGLAGVAGGSGGGDEQVTVWFWLARLLSFLFLSGEDTHVDGRS